MKNEETLAKLGPQYTEQWRDSGNIRPTIHRTMIKTKYTQTHTHNTICVGHNYGQAKPNNVHMIWALPQTTEAKEEKRLMRKS